MDSKDFTEIINWMYVKIWAEFITDDFICPFVEKDKKKKKALTQNIHSKTQRTEFTLC